MSVKRKEHRHSEYPTNINHEENHMDLNNYKGIFYNDTDQKYQDPVTGAHFDYYDMCCRLLKLQKSAQGVLKNLVIQKLSACKKEGRNMYDMIMNIDFMKRIEHLVNLNKI